MTSRKLDRTGQRFGMLTVKSLFSYINYNSRWLCLCDCGNETIVSGSNLQAGHTTSCGCYALSVLKKRSVTHGMTKTDTYICWAHIKARCYNPKEKSYEKYGGRGIMMCDEWLNDFPRFLADMGERPSKLHTIERIDVNGNYEPSNCKWATQKEQQNNRSNNNRVEYDGEIMTVAQLSEKIKVKADKIYYYVRKFQTKKIPHGIN